MQRQSYFSKAACVEDRRIYFPQLSRIISGETKTVSNDILIGLANEFKISADYILGLSNVSIRKAVKFPDWDRSRKLPKGL